MYLDHGKQRELTYFLHRHKLDNPHHITPSPMKNIAIPTGDDHPNIVFQFIINSL